MKRLILLSMLMLPFTYVMSSDIGFDQDVKNESVRQIYTETYAKTISNTMEIALKNIEDVKETYHRSLKLKDISDAKKKSLENIETLKETYYNQPCFKDIFHTTEISLKNIKALKDIDYNQLCLNNLSAWSRACLNSLHEVSDPLKEMYAFIVEKPIQTQDQLNLYYIWIESVFYDVTTFGAFEEKRKLLFDYFEPALNDSVYKQAFNTFHTLMTCMLINIVERDKRKSAKDVWDGDKWSDAVTENLLGRFVTMYKAWGYLTGSALNAHVTWGTLPKDNA